jgi:hypothetical protein
MLRSAVAVLVGFVYIGGLSFGADLLLRQAMPAAFDSAGRVESAPVLLLIIAYVGVFAVSGCYLAARLAPRDPMRHALVLGALGLVVNIVGAAMLWHTAPAWFHVVSLLLVLPYAWAGGRLREVELAQASAPVRAVPAL